MMTLHAAKGLEFRCVYIVAVEQGYLPHERNYKDPIKVEEERRLFFVGITRAKEKLQVSSCANRNYRGQRTPVIASSFLIEIRDDVEVINLPSFSPAYAQPARRPATPTIPSSSGLKLVTGSQLLGESRTEEDVLPNNPDDFDEGMLVNHPKYGPGVVVQISGEGKRRMARIKFFATPGKHSSFSLYHSELRPAAS